MNDDANLPEMADREDRPEPADGRRVDASTAGCLAFAVAIVFPALLYFGFFAAVLLDEEVFGTRYLADLIPDPAKAVLRVIYTPLLWLIDRIDG